MSKFDWALSQQEKDEIVNSAHDIYGAPCLYELADRVEQAVLAKLAKQEPVATVRYLMGGIDLKVADGRRLPKGMRLYAAPAPAIEQKPSAWFIDDKRVCGNRIITDPAIAGDWLENDPDKVTPLYTHPSPSLVSDKAPCVLESSECDKQDAELLKQALDTHRLNAKERHKTTKNHIPEGWQLVPENPTENQIISAMEASLLGRPSIDDEAYVVSIIDAYLAAVPKHEEGPQ